MRSLIVLATGLAVLGFTVPTLTAAKAETVIIKRHNDRGWHRNWHGEFGGRRIVIERHHDRGWHRGWNHDRY